MKTIRSAWVIGFLALGLPLEGQADTAADVQKQCASCHNLTQPDYKALGVKERIERKAPPLFYAGNKYQAEWLTAWLQKPDRIHPAGVFAPKHTRVGEKGEEIDPATLPPHPTLSADAAKTIADYLMTLRPFDALIGAEAYVPGSIAMKMGKMNFDKFKGCSGCHRDEPNVGGVSGPELYTAWKRLQPAFITSYITNPVAWDPNTMMPHAPLNAAEVYKLADYLKGLTEVQP